MFSIPLRLFASKEEFRFVGPDKQAAFRPMVFLGPDHQVLSIGEARGIPDSEGIPVFDAPDRDALPLLESLLRHGFRAVLNSFELRPISLEITISGDLRDHLKGFAPAILQLAATQAGAAHVSVRLAS